VIIVTDPIADMLTRIRNASRANHDVVEVPASKIKMALADILKEEGFISRFEVSKRKPQDVIRIHLKYGPKREAVITGITRVSKPGIRVYARHTEIPKVLNGLGVAVLSTSKGILTDKAARAAGVGGEVLCYVW
jgi:small subunit ribosomal protein S8